MSKFSIAKARLQSRFYLHVLQILGVFGIGFLAACVKYGAPEPEYGIPWEDDGVNFYGNVKSQDSLQNLSGIEVQLIDPDYQDTSVTVTNADGNYQIYHYTWEGQSLKLRFLDVDSLANHGLFQNKTMDIEVSGRDYNNHEKKMDALLDTL